MYSVYIIVHNSTVPPVCVIPLKVFSSEGKRGPVEGCRNFQGDFFFSFDFAI